MEGGLINPLALIRTGAAKGVTSGAQLPHEGGVPISPRGTTIRLPLGRFPPIGFRKRVCRDRGFQDRGFQDRVDPGRVFRGQVCPCHRLDPNKAAQGAAIWAGVLGGPGWGLAWPHPRPRAIQAPRGTREAPSGSHKHLGERPDLHDGPRWRLSPAGCPLSLATAGYRLARPFSGIRRATAG